MSKIRPLMVRFRFEAPALKIPRLPRLPTSGFEQQLRKFAESMKPPSKKELEDLRRHAQGMAGTRRIVDDPMDSDTEMTQEARDKAARWLDKTFAGRCQNGV